MVGVLSLDQAARVDYFRLGTKNVILTLTDENAAAKLLGVQVDIE